jgi:hypothetical protein
MKKTLITAVALVACAGTQLFAQNAKEGAITFSLSLQQQASVSTSTGNNQGGWSQGPQYYKSTTLKRATADVIQAIGFVLHRNPGYYSSKAQLVLVQGELGGFFNLGDTLGTFDGPETDLANGDDNGGEADVTGFVTTQQDLGARLATGRHFRPSPVTELWPPGHHQPWGQIFVKDPGKTGYSTTDPLCENVTFFFTFVVQECYDCFYLNSFVTDATFKFKSGNSAGPPCCTTPVDLTGSGKDRYYLTMSFDNTFNNPYLNAANDAWIGKATWSPWYRTDPANWVVGIGMLRSDIPGDGMTPDLLTYHELIGSGIGTFNKYVMRFTLNGIVTYTWAMKLVNPSDVVYDFVGSATYPATGYGFVSLACSLITGTVGIAEKIITASNCCLDIPYYDSWYGTGWNLFQDQYPIVAIDGDPADGAYFGSPVNTPYDLSLHLGYNEWYEARWQWPQSTPSELFPGGGYSPAQPETIVGTQIDTRYTPPDSQTRIPSARGMADRSNTDWPDTGAGGGK